MNAKRCVVEVKQYVSPVNYRVAQPAMYIHNDDSRGNIAMAGGIAMLMFIHNTEPERKVNTSRHDRMNLHPAAGQVYGYG